MNVPWFRRRSILLDGHDYLHHHDGIEQVGALNHVAVRLSFNRSIEEIQFQNITVLVHQRLFVDGVYRALKTMPNLKVVCFLENGCGSLIQNVLWYGRRAIQDIHIDSNRKTPEYLGSQKWDALRKMPALKKVVFEPYDLQFRPAGLLHQISLCENLQELRLHSSFEQLDDNDARRIGALPHCKKLALYMNGFSFPSTMTVTPALQPLIESLKRNTILEELEIEVGLTKVDGLLIAEVLEHNTRLEKLTLQCHKELGLAPIAGALKINKNLTALEIRGLEILGISSVQFEGKVLDALLEMLKTNTVLSTVEIFKLIVPDPCNYTFPLECQEITADQYAPIKFRTRTNRALPSHCLPMYTPPYVLIDKLSVYTAHPSTPTAHPSTPWWRVLYSMVMNAISSNATTNSEHPELTACFIFLSRNLRLFSSNLRSMGTAGMSKWFVLVCVDTKLLKPFQEQLPCAVDESVLIPN